jgi:hypothetical protein
LGGSWLQASPGKNVCETPISVGKKLGVVVCNCHSSYSRKYKTGELQSRSYSEDLSSKYEQKGPRGMAQAVKHLACKGETQVLPRLRERVRARDKEREKH